MSHALRARAASVMPAAAQSLVRGAPSNERVRAVVFLVLRRGEEDGVPTLGTVLLGRLGARLSTARVVGESQLVRRRALARLLQWRWLRATGPHLAAVVLLPSAPYSWLRLRRYAPSHHVQRASHAPAFATYLRVCSWPLQKASAARF